MNTKFLLSLSLLISTTAYTADIKYKVDKNLEITAWEVTEEGEEVPLNRMSPVPAFVTSVFVMTPSKGSCASSCAHKTDNCATACPHGVTVGDIEDLLNE